MKKTALSSLFCLIYLFGLGQEVKAQKVVGQFIKDTVKDVALDPTTYIPAGLLWTSIKGDWNTSQPLFTYGYVETNPLFTINGQPFSQPISFADGNRKIAMFTLWEGLGVSMLANTGIRLGEHILINRHPEKKSLVHSAGWATRIGFAVFRGYVLSHQHFKQWQTNKRLAIELNLN